MTVAPSRSTTVFLTALEELMTQGGIIDIDASGWPVGAIGFRHKGRIMLWPHRAVGAVARLLALADNYQYLNVRSIEAELLESGHIELANHRSGRRYAIRWLNNSKVWRLKVVGS